MAIFDLTSVIDIRAASRDRFSIPDQTIIFSLLDRGARTLTRLLTERMTAMTPYCPLAWSRYPLQLWAADYRQLTSASSSLFISFFSFRFWCSTNVGATFVDKTEDRILSEIFRRIVFWRFSLFLTIFWRFFIFFLYLYFVFVFFFVLNLT